MAPKFGLFTWIRAMDDFTSHSDTPPTRTGANWLTFCDETGGSSLQLQQFATGNFPVSNSVAEWGVSEWLMKSSTQWQLISKTLRYYEYDRED